MNCPICIAGSGSGRGKEKSQQECIAALQHYSVTNSRAQLLLSGGEPTIHSAFLEVLEFACGQQWSRVILVTNGVRIANDPQFAESIARFRDRLEVHLQFDTLDDQALIRLRGEALSPVRRRALVVLNEQHISTTLVSVYARGITDTAIGEVISVASSYSQVVGITFQPLRKGRAKVTANMDTSCCLDEVVQAIGLSLGGDWHMFQPTVEAPFNYWFAFMDVRTQRILPPAELESDRQAFPRAISGGCLRLGVLFHMDRETYFGSMETSGLIGIEDGLGSIRALDRYYLGVH